MKRAGIMGGTFDPIHLGHLRAAENAREELGLQEVVFVPAGVPPHRQAPLASALDRFTMAALATAGHPGFRTSPCELRREGPSYTVDTVAAFREEWPGVELVLIVGSDTFPELAGWRERDRLLSLCTLAVVARPDQGTAGSAPMAGSVAVARVTAAGLPISGTGIRERIAAGRSVRYLVPDGVAEYIAKRGLYR
mgnify:FL=1